MSTGAPPASFTAFHGSVSSTCSTPSVTTNAMRLPFSSSAMSTPSFHARVTDGLPTRLRGINAAQPAARVYGPPSEVMRMLNDCPTHATLPAEDFARARAVYEGTLGFPPVV